MATSPDGTKSAPPSGAALTTAAGTWTWSSAASGRPGEYYVNLNGSAVGIGLLMEVANGGQLYVNTATLGWYLWQGSSWAHSTDPAAPPPPPPPSTSPDGTKSTAPSGAALRTAAGTWAWGAAASGRPGEYNVNLNGSAVGVGLLIEVAKGGQLYVNTANLGWYLWQGSGWVHSTDPGPSPPPPAPTPTSVTLTPASLSLPDNSPSGTSLSTVSVAMSDGSTFAGSLTIGANNMAGLSGSSVVLTRALTAADDGAHSFLITATQNAVSKQATLALSVTANAPSGPKAEWTLTQASVSGASVADASGHGNTATVTNGPLTFGTMGANFSGSQHVDCPMAVNWPALTVSVWFNAANLSNSYPRIIAYGASNRDNTGFQLQFNLGGSDGWFGVGNGTANVLARWYQQLAIGAWYHYVGVYDGATAFSYLNGVQVGSVPFAGGAIAAGSGNMVSLARNPTYDGDYFIGAISDVRIYDRSLSAAEILAMYHAAPTPTAITLSPASATIPDNAPAGTLVATAAVTMSDGSQFTGTLTTSNALFAISGLNVVTARALTAADDGSRSTVITASQGGSQPFSVELAV